MRSWTSIGRRLAVVCLCLCLVSTLLPAAVTMEGTTPDTPDGTTPDTHPGESPGTDVEIDEEIFEETGSIEFVVRLEEATVADADDPERTLEDHAEKTQQPLLEYVDTTAGLTLEEEFWVTNAVVLTVETELVDGEVLSELEAIEGVEMIHENFELTAPEPPEPTAVDLGEDDDTEDVPPTPALEQIHVPEVWDRYDTRGEGVRVAVLDTGVDADHPDIDLYTDTPGDPTYPGGWAEFDHTGDRLEDSTPHDTDTHGTHVSGTVAGGTESATAIGVAPEAELLHGLVLTGDGGTFAQIVAGIEWALEEDADVINLSLGSTGAFDQLIAPVQHATESDVVVVAAIGNAGPETSGSPGNVYETISVGAVDATDQVPSFSGGERLNRTDWGDAPEQWPETYVVPTVTAPGVDIVSAVPGGYASKPGTSMATPHVSGIAALALSVEPDTTPEELSTALTETAWKPDGEPTTQDPRYGHGIVDASATVDQLAEQSANTSTLEDGSSDQADTDRVGSPGVAVVALALGVLLATLLGRTD